MEIKAHINVYNSKGAKVGAALHTFADAAVIADIILMHYNQHCDCIIDFDNGNHISPTLARMAYVETFYGTDALRREILSAVEEKANG